MITLNLPRFELGEIRLTPGAIAALQKAGQTADEFLVRHVRGDWGVVSEGDKEANDLALQDGSRVLSAYLLQPGVKLWVITDASGDDGRREATCLLLPDEY